MSLSQISTRVVCKKKDEVLTHPESTLFGCFNCQMKMSLAQKLCCGRETMPNSASENSLDARGKNKSNRLNRLGENCVPTTKTFMR